MEKKESYYDTWIKSYLETQKDAFTLDISGKQLLDPSIIAKELKDASRKNLCHLSLNNNLLVSLTLPDKNTLTTLSASHNSLLEVNLYLKNLQELDLSYNCLEKIPDLRDMRKLEIVKIDHNRITKMDNERFPKYITEIDLSANWIEVSGDEDSFFNELKECVLRLKSLKKLSLANNPIAIKYPERVTLLEPQHTEKVELELSAEAPAANEYEQPKEKSLLGRMREHLMNANKSPANCSKELNKLLDLLNPNSLNTIAFKNAFNEKECNVFFEELDTLHSSQHKHRKEIYTILANLLYLKEMRSKTVQALLMHMRSSRESFEKVGAAIEKTVVRDLQYLDYDILPIDILKELCNIAKVCTISNFLKRLIGQFSRHLISIKEYEVNEKTDEYYTLTTYVLGVLVAGFKENPENVKSVMEAGSNDDTEELILPSEFADAIKHFLVQESLKKIAISGIIPHSERYDYIIQIISHCSAQSKKAARIFYRKTCDTFLEYLRMSHERYNSIYREEISDVELIKAICRRFSSEILCFATQINSGLIEKDPIDEVLLKVVGELLQLVTKQKIDPFVLFALCELALSFLRKKQIIENDKLMYRLVENMGEVCTLMEFLTMAKWPELYNQSKKYLSNPSAATPLIQEVRQGFLYNVITSIVKIISFFCTASRKTKCASAGVIAKVNEAFNSSNREDVLFDLLNTHSLEVKLSVMDCLNNVPLDQLSKDEMQRIFSLIVAYKNPNGKEAIVLAKLIWVISKLVKDQEDEVGKMFRDAFGKKTIELVISILMNTNLMSSNAEHNEYQEFLSLSCVHYLQCASMTSDLVLEISSYTTAFCSILKYEEALHQAVPTAYSLEVERTGMGCNTMNILKLFTTAAVLNPYSGACLRVLQILAAIFSASNQYDSPKVFADELKEEEEGQDPVALIKADLERRDKKRKEDEEKMWDNLSVSKERLNTIGKEIDMLKKNIMTFTDSCMIDILLNYFLGTGANSTHPEMAEYIESFSRGKFPEGSLLKPLKDKVEQFQKEFLEGCEKETKEEAKKVISTSAEERIGYELEKEPLKYTGELIEYMPSRGLSLNVSEKGILRDSQNAKVQHKKESILQPYESQHCRALVASAIMRCIYNSYAYCEECREELLKQLRDKKTLMALTQLCFTTGWIEANVGIKYLIICKFILQLKNNEAFTEVTRVVLDQIVCAALCDMISLIDIRIKSERKMPLTEKENKLVIQITEFSVFIIHQTKYLDYISVKDILLGKDLSSVGNDLDFVKYFVTIPKVKTHGMRATIPQYQCSAYCVKSLLPFTSIKTIISFLFYLDRRTIKERSKHNAKESLSNIETALTRAVIALATYICICPEEKCRVLEGIMSEAVLAKHYIRKSHIQEMLNFWQKGFISQILVLYKKYKRYL